jgi:phosphatidylglycerol:prolipoprotein diacylglycerol transferase
MMHPNFDPVAFSLGPLQFRWYGFMYMLGFAAAWLLARRRIRRGRNDPLAPAYGWTQAEFDDLVTWTFLGVILGGRAGYVLFYDLPSFIADPLEIFRIWHGGMSFHGGLLGTLIAFRRHARKSGRTFLEVSDFIAPLIPPGLFFGRIGNFINGELWGRPSALPWAVIFPNAGPAPRHPSQLYEAALEGVALFAALWLISARKREAGMISGLFALLYALVRFAAEFAREPDAHLGYPAFGLLTMGQLLCLPLAAAGALLMARARRKPPEDGKS